MPFLLVGRWAGGVRWSASGRRGSCAGRSRPMSLTSVDSDCLVGGGWFGWLGFGLGAAGRAAAAGAAAAGRAAGRRRSGSTTTCCAWTPTGSGGSSRCRRTRSRRSRRCADAGPVARGAVGRWRCTAGGARCTAPRSPSASSGSPPASCSRRTSACGSTVGSPATRPSAFAGVASRCEPAYGAFFGLDDDGAVLSFSPELFLRRVGRVGRDRADQGHRAASVRGRRRRARDALAASAKDAAEHVMIVDLMRNDLGRVAAYGSRRPPPRSPDVEAHPGVWHLVSRVRATLRDGVGDGELLRATFPPGSVTGAPKVQALKVISELEGTEREVYTGAIGYVSPVAGPRAERRDPDARGPRATRWLGCGGGIVADSDPEAELREALGKARPIVEALGSSVPAVDAAAARPRSCRSRASNAPTRRAASSRRSPSATALPVDLDRHLARLAASASSSSAASTRPRAARAAVRPRRPPRCGSCVTPDGASSVSVAPDRRRPARRRPARARSSSPAASASTSGPTERRSTPHPDALILDLDGTVLETRPRTSGSSRATARHPARRRPHPARRHPRPRPRAGRRTRGAHRPRPAPRRRRHHRHLRDPHRRRSRPRRHRAHHPSPRGRREAPHADSYARARGPVAQLVRAADS